VFANVATAFETPTTTELADPSGSGGFNSDLDAQTAVEYELGVKGVVADRLRVEAVGFLIDVDDELVPFEVAGMPGRTFFENAGSSRRSGFELALVAEPCDGLTASLAYTFSHFEFDRFRTAAGDFDGNDLPGIPRNRLWGELAYEHPWGFYGIWEVSYADGVYADNANLVKSDSHVVADFRAGWLGELGGFEIGPFVGLANVFGEKYLDNVRLNAAFGRSFEPAPELAVYGGLSIGYRFGGP
jgi:iron complex outermembrane receptor protein